MKKEPPPRTVKLFHLKLWLSLILAKCLLGPGKFLIIADENREKLLPIKAHISKQNQKLRFTRNKYSCPVGRVTFQD
jgi:hypothetical protein